MQTRIAIALIASVAAQADFSIEGAKERAEANREAFNPIPWEDIQD